MFRLLAATSLTVLAVATPALAQTARTPAPVRGDQHVHAEDIVVTAPIQRSETDVLSGTSIVHGEELARDLRQSIGETLARQPGVSASSFGPSASRPILRGFQGDRVRVLTDGIGSIDVSNTSADHATIIDPLLADRIEVLRGPAALLFGSSAVGGVVNVIDTRIPRRLPENGYRLAGTATYGSAANERSGGLAGDVAVGEHLVLHADGSYLKADDLRTGGYLLSRTARATALASAALPPDDQDHGGHQHEPIDFAANAGLKGKLLNSAAETWTAGVGASIIAGNSSLGISYNHYDSLYGVPIRYAILPDQEQHAPRLDVAQDRVDLRADVATGGGFLDRIRLRAGHASYRHYELEEDGAIGTAFYNKGTEARLELVQAKRGGWQGASGVQYFNRNFNVVGDEAFLPKSETSQFGVFTLQALEAGPIKVEGGLRYDVSDVAARPVAGDLRFFNGKRHFETLSGSLGASYEVADGWRIGLNGSRTERAPSAEELFAAGAHAGTQVWELGNPDFTTEKSWGLEATLHGHAEGFSIDASAYYSWFDDFIFDRQVAQSVCEGVAAPYGGEVELPCFQNGQANARYYGFEVDASARLATIGGTTINADLVGDYVHATIDGVGPAPRIPPLRLLGGIEAQSDAITGRVEVEHVFTQKRIAAFETPTADYTLVNASVAWKPFGTERTVLMLSANNLLDVVARRHASYLKDFAPLAGRDIRATLRFSL